MPTSTTDPKPSPLPVANYWLNLCNTIIAKYMSYGEGVATTFAIGEVPFLGWPVVRIFFSWGLNFVGNLLTRQQEIAIDGLVIDILKGEETSEVYIATAAIMAAKKSGDQNAKATAIANAKAAYDKALRNSGWSTNVQS